MSRAKELTRAAEQQEALGEAAEAECRHGAAAKHFARASTLYADAASLKFDQAQKGMVVAMVLLALSIVLRVAALVLS